MGIDVSNETLSYSILVVEQLMTVRVSDSFSFWTASMFSIFVSLKDEWWMARSGWCYLWWDQIHYCKK